VIEKMSSASWGLIALLASVLAACSEHGSHEEDGDAGAADAATLSDGDTAITADADTEMDASEGDAAEADAAARTDAAIKDGASAEGGASGCLGDAGTSCSGHGTCAAEVCACEAGYTGRNCDACATGFTRDGSACVSAMCGAIECLAPAVCERNSGRCCSCHIGASECSNGKVRRCTDLGGGCGGYSTAVSCGATGCLNAEICDLGENVAIEQWGAAQLDEVHSVCVSASGQPIVAGRTDGMLPGQTAAGKQDLFVELRPSNAEQAWSRQWGTSEDDYATGVVQEPDGSVVVAGNLYVAPAADASLTKLRADHSQAWSVHWGSTLPENVADLAHDTAGNFYVAGWTAGDLATTNLGGFDAFLTKLASDGSVVWSVQFGTSEEELVTQIALDAQGNTFVTGSTRGAFAGNAMIGGGADIFLSKVTPQGVVAWTRQWGSSADDGGLDLASESDGSLTLIGYTRGMLPGASGSNGAFVSRLDATGQVLWTKQFGASVSDGAVRLALRADGNFFIVGQTFAELVTGRAAGGADVFVQGRNHAGDVLWTRQLGSKGTDIPLAIAASADHVFAAGTTAGNFPGQLLMGLWDNFLLTVSL
jgi:hypothetical protein